MKAECKDCHVRQFIARRFDLHWHDEEDCPMECPYGDPADWLENYIDTKRQEEAQNG